MKGFCSILTLCLLLHFSVVGQNTDIGLIVGSAYYLGELNPGTPVVNKIRPAIGVFYRKNINKRYALRFGANYGQLAASDQLNTSALSEYRQLSFSSDLLDAYGVLEFNFIPYQINNYSTSSFTPYVFIGVAGFLVNPTVSGEITDLQKEDIAGVAIPFGLGVKFNFVRNLGLGIEWGMRKTFSDQIDGLAPTYYSGYQLSNSNNNDWYSILGITLNYKILTKSDYCRGPVN